MELKIKLSFFNDHWNVFIKPSEHLNWNLQQTDLMRKSSYKGGQFELKTYRIDGAPFYLFGFSFLPDNPNAQRGASRPSLINDVYGTELLDVSYDGFAFAMTKAHLEDLMVGYANVRPYISGGETFLAAVPLHADEDKNDITFTVKSF